MEPKSALRSFSLLTGSLLLAISSASATEYWWDNNNTAAFRATKGTRANPPTAGAWW